jgi:ABC-type Fe3+-hydroxamate transport system substrate-binding protein
LTIRRFVRHDIGGLRVNSHLFKIVGLLAGVTLLLAGCGSSSSEATQTTTTSQTTTTETTGTEYGPTVVRIAVVNAAPQRGIVRQTVKKGDMVVISVTSDTADEIHLHGYDIKRDVAAGGTARIPFTATIPGRFEVELESRGVQIADLTVQP